MCAHALAIDDGTAELDEMRCYGSDMLRIVGRVIEELDVKRVLFAKFFGLGEPRRLHRPGNIHVCSREERMEPIVQRIEYIPAGKLGEDVNTHERVGSRREPFGIRYTVRYPSYGRPWYRNPGGKCRNVR